MITVVSRTIRTEIAVQPDAYRIPQRSIHGSDDGVLELGRAELERPEERQREREGDQRVRTGRSSVALALRPGETRERADAAESPDSEVSIQ